MNQHWIEAFRYHRWANLFVLDFCSKLTDAQLELTLPGTYGAIHATLQHMVSAEQRYIGRLSGDEPEITEREMFPGVERLSEIARRGGDRLMELAATIEPDPHHTAKFGGRTVRIEPGIILIQALHHGNDHRTHVCTILGAHGFERGDMDVWAFAYATGAAEDVSV